MRREYRVHPAIGIARVGNSRTSWFDGPEVPDLDFVPGPNGWYRDASGAIRRQAVKFRIYEYTFDDRNELSGVRQITDLGAEIHLHVHLANLKAFTSNPNSSNQIPVPNDPGDKTVSGPSQSQDIVGNVFGADVQLGTLMTDPNAVLRVLGGLGRSESPSGAAPGIGLYWPNWFDDVSDGPVRATIRSRDAGG